MALRFDGFYQGVPLLSCSFPRSDGLQPEYGTAEALVKDIPSFKVNFRAVEFPRGQAVAMFTSIQQWYRDLLTGKTVSEDNDPIGDLNVPKILEPFGDLVLRSFDGKRKVAEVVYKHVVIAPQGFREVTDGLGDPRAHKDGRARFTLTDVRHYYRENGGVITRINVKLKSGRWDPQSVQPNGQPWPARLAVPYLFTHLPGAPRVHSSSLLYRLAANCPELILEGEPAVQACQSVLDKLGLVAKLQPEGNTYVVGRRVDKKVDHKKLYAGPGVELNPAPRTFHDEKRSAWTTGRPAAVHVIGKRQVRRITLACVPVFQDTDGRIYRLADVEKRWGYKLSQVSEQATVSPEKQYEDVPPSPFGGGASAELHWQRKEIARRWFYRGYAPEAMFVSAVQVGGVPSLADVDFETVPYLPMVGAPFYLSEISAISKKLPTDTKRGDRGEFALLNPVVRARQVAQAFFGEWKQAEAYFKGVLANVKIGTDYCSSQIAQQKAVIADALREITRQSEALKDVKTGKDAQASISIEADVKVLGETYGIDVDTRVLRDTEGNAVLNKELRIIERAQKDIAKTEALLKEEKQVAAEWRKQLDLAKQAYDHGFGLPFWSTLPHQVINGGYSLDPDSGIILFGELTATLDRSFAYSLEQAKVIADGHVLVTFGYELRKGAANDFTSVILVADPEDDAAGISVAGINRSCAIHAKVERAPEMRMYSTELGTPMNLGACLEEALGAAQAQLQGPRTVVGYKVDYIGLQRCALVDGVNGVQHVLGNDGSARTVVMFNDPSGDGPLGPPSLAEGSAATGQIDARGQLEGSAV